MIFKLYCIILKKRKKTRQYKNRQSKRARTSTRSSTQALTGPKPKFEKPQHSKPKFKSHQLFQTKCVVQHSNRVPGTQMTRALPNHIIKVDPIPVQTWSFPNTKPRFFQSSPNPQNKANIKVDVLRQGRVRHKLIAKQNNSGLFAGQVKPHGSGRVGSPDPTLTRPDRRTCWDVWT